MPRHPLILDGSSPRHSPEGDGGRNCACTFYLVFKEPDGWRRPEPLSQPVCGRRAMRSSVGLPSSGEPSNTTEGSFGCQAPLRFFLPLEPPRSSGWAELKRLSLKKNRRDDKKCSETFRSNSGALGTGSRFELTQYTNTKRVCQPPSALPSPPSAGAPVIRPLTFAGRPRRVRSETIGAPREARKQSLY
jgi:hypothetical protein